MYQKLGKSQREKNLKYVASVAVFSEEGLLLFGKRADNNKWSLPGGHFEPGEYPTQAAIRELWEEAKLVPLKDIEFLGDGKVPGANVHVFSFKVHVDKEPDSGLDPDEEFSEFKWVNPDRIPTEITDNLHSPKNVTLQLLGLQEKTLIKSDGKYWKCIDGLNIPHKDNPKRLIWDEAYLSLAKETFAKNGEQVLDCEVDLNENQGYNIVKSEARLKLYKKMIGGGETLPPLVLRYDDDGLNLIDGNHRQKAYLESGITKAKAVIIYTNTLKKSFINSVLLGGLLMGGATKGVPKSTAQTIAANSGIKVWTPDGLNTDLYPIAHLESSWGDNINHAPNAKGEYHTAFGALGFKPSTAHEEYKKSKVLKDKFPGLEDPADFLKTFKNDTSFYNTLASTHFARLKAKHGDTSKAAYAWRWGSSAASNADDKTIQSDPYVVKYNKMAQEKPAPIKKANDPHDYNKVLSDALVEQGFEPDANHLKEKVDLDSKKYRNDRRASISNSRINDARLDSSAQPQWGVNETLDSDIFDRESKKSFSLNPNSWVVTRHEEGQPDKEHGYYTNIDDFGQPTLIFRRAAHRGSWWQPEHIVHDDPYSLNQTQQNQAVSDHFNRIFKSEAGLAKMAIKDIKPGEKRPGLNTFDYSHLHNDPDIDIKVKEIHNFNRPVKYKVTATHSTNGLAGEVDGYIHYDQPRAISYIEPHSWVAMPFRGQGLGKALYEALYTHAFNNDIKEVQGGPHTADAHRVHEALARKHGLSFSAPLGKRGPYKYTLKSEDLQKMAIKDLKPGTQKTNPYGVEYYDYSHLIKSPLVRRNYQIKVHYSPLRQNLGVDIVRRKSGEPVGHMFSGIDPEENSLDIGSSRIHDSHRGKGLGKAMYLAAFSHAYNNLGVRNVQGFEHSSLAHKVHQSIAKEHRLEYKPKKIGQESGDFDAAYGGYEYKLK